MKFDYSFLSGSFFGNLTIAFIVLKLLNKITWGWLWVLSPLLIPITIASIFFIGAMLIAWFNY